MSQEHGCELLLLNAIRTGTVLSRFPIHNLAKGHKVKIEISQKKDSGEVELKWIVHPNPAFGEPGLLAYKLDIVGIPSFPTLVQTYEQTVDRSSFSNSSGISIAPSLTMTD